MRRVAHVSDLHFGRADMTVAEGLAADLRQEKVDVVLVSGDLTQRARPVQFEAARKFLDSIGIPWRAVPGNHDIPLFDLGRRALAPYGRYTRIVHEELEPPYQDDELAVLGINTVLPRVWKGGLVRPSAFVRLRKWSEDSGDRARIVFAHHPFTRANTSKADLVRRWKEAVQAMEEASVDLLLTGHQHRFGHSESREYVVDGPHRLIVVRASTAISHRRRGEPNSYNLIHVHRDRIAIEGRIWKEGRFQESAVHEYRRIAWRGPPSVPLREPVAPRARAKRATDGGAGDVTGPGRRPRAPTKRLVGPVRRTR